MHLKCEKKLNILRCIFMIIARKKYKKKRHKNEVEKIS